MKTIAVGLAVLMLAAVSAAGAAEPIRSWPFAVDSMKCVGFLHSTRKAREGDAKNENFAKSVVDWLAGYVRGRIDATKEPDHLRRISPEEFVAAIERYCKDNLLEASIRDAGDAMYRFVRSYSPPK